MASKVFPVSIDVGEKLKDSMDIHKAVSLLSKASGYLKDLVIKYEKEELSKLQKSRSKSLHQILLSTLTLAQDTTTLGAEMKDFSQVRSLALQRIHTVHRDIVMSICRTHRLICFHH